MGKSIFCFILVFTSWLFATASSASIFVVPSDMENIAGDVRNRAPFAPIDPSISSQPVPRYQQIYGEEALTSLVGVDISGIAFRVDESPGFNGDVAGGFIYDNIEIRLSTTLMSVDALSTDLQSNVGADEVVVFNSSYVLPNLEGDQEINPFDMAFFFSSSFAYQGGNLLVDIFMPEDTPAAFYLDAVWQGGLELDAISRAYIRTGTTPVSDTLGLVTQFNPSPVPVPSTFVLLATGGLCPFAYAWRKRRR